MSGMVEPLMYLWMFKNQYTIPGFEGAQELNNVSTTVAPYLAGVINPFGLEIEAVDVTLETASVVAAEGGQELLLDTNVVIGQGKQFVASGANVVKAEATDVELANLVNQGRIGMPRAASQIPSVS